MKKIQDFLTSPKFKNKTLLVTGSLQRRIKVIDTVQTAINLCNKNNPNSEFHVIINNLPLTRPINCPRNSTVIIIIDSEDILDNRWVKQYYKVFKIIVVFYDRYQPKIRTFRESSFCIEVTLESTTKKSPFQILNVLSSVHDRKTLAQRLEYLEDKDTFMLPFYVQENVPVMAHNLAHLADLCDMTSIGDLLNPMLDTEVIAPLRVCFRNCKVNYKVPKTGYYRYTF